jgi:hypothetical protein
MTQRRKVELMTKKPKKTTSDFIPFRIMKDPAKGPPVTATITREFNAWWKATYPSGAEFKALKKQCRRAFEAGFRKGMRYE